MPRLDVSIDYLLNVLEDLVNTPSPSGDTAWAVRFVQNQLESFGAPSALTRKGALISTLPGLSDTNPRALTAHIDTLGAMVAEIKPNGRLRLTAINSLMWPTVESEGCTVHARGGTNVRGSLVLANGADHVNKEARTAPRNADTMEVRLDERTKSKEETQLLGISVGDFVSFDPRFEKSASGFVRSRFLDDKACVACLLAAVKALHEAGVSPAQRTHLLFSNYEEVGHGGMDGLPEDLAEFLVLDMAVVGTGCAGDEHHCSICLKDSASPYSRELSDKIIGIAAREGVELVPDIYPYYGSDGSAYWRAGGRAQVALIGPGVDTSHGYERTHVEALKATATLIAEYLLED